MGDLSGVRQIAAMKEMKCYYCKVPTAATIEHVVPRAQGGTTWMKNLVLACPYCNTKKSTREFNEFCNSGDWRLEHPPLPETMEQMLLQFFGVQLDNLQEEKKVRTNSPHSQLLLTENTAYALIRAGKKFKWTRVEIGPISSPKTVAASYDFLKRHHTPKEPKPIPGKYWVNKG